MKMKKIGPDPGGGGAIARSKFYNVDPPLEIFHYLSFSIVRTFFCTKDQYFRVFRVIAVIHMSREEEKRRATMVTNSAP